MTMREATIQRISHVTTCLLLLLIQRQPLVCAFSVSPPPAGHSLLVLTHQNIAAPSPSRVLRGQDCRSRTTLLRFTIDEADKAEYLEEFQNEAQQQQQQQEEEEHSVRDVEYMAMFVANRLCCMLLKKRMKHVEETTQIQPKPETLTVVHEPLPTLEDNMERKTWPEVLQNNVDTTISVPSTAVQERETGTPKENENETDVKALRLPREPSDNDKDDATESSSSLSTGEILPINDNNTKGEAFDPLEEELLEPVVVTGRFATVVPEVPAEISLTFGKPLEVERERIPPLQKPLPQAL